MCGGVPSHSLFNQADPRRPEATTCGRLRSRSRFQPGDATAGCGADAGGPERKPGSPGTPARWRGEACSVHTHEAARRFQPRLPGHSAHTPPAPRARRRPHGRGHTSLRPRRPAPDHLMSRVPWCPPTSGSSSGVAPPSLPQRRRPVELSPRRARTRPRPPRPRRKWTPRVPASRGPFGHPQTLLGACSLQPGLRRAWASARGSWGAAGGPGRGPCPHPREGGREVEGTFLRVGEITTGVRSSPTSAHRRPFQRFL